VIVVDASALVAIYLNEPERGRFLTIIEEASAALIAPINAFQALAKAHALDGEPGAGRMQALIAALGLQVPPCAMEDVQAAVTAFARYGRRTPAKASCDKCDPSRAANAYRIYRTQDALDSKGYRAAYRLEVGPRDAPSVRPTSSLLL
jgi:uncharacterized protein with PIN domain